VVTVNAVPLTSEMYAPHKRMVAAVTALAKIPEAKHAAFNEGITVLCDTLEEFTSPKNTDAKVIAAAQAVRTARNAVLALNPSQARQLAEAAQFARRPPCVWVSAVDPLNEPHVVHAHGSVPGMMEYADAAFGELIGRSANYQPSGKRGRAKGAVADPGLRYVVVTLWRLVQENGGELTLRRLGKDPSFATGGIVRALHLLAPHLPQGLIPKGDIKYSFLETLKDKALKPLKASQNLIGIL
jgi:hypothetical protein